jgi:hypothetical protein
VFVAKQVTVLDTRGVEHVARAIGQAASWVGSTSVTVESVEPPSTREGLLKVLAG